MTINDPQHLLVKIVDILDELKIDYLVTGGIAVLIWGRPRFTADIDFIIEIEKKDIQPLERALKKLSHACYIDLEMMKEAFSRNGEFNFIDGNSGIKVDFWILKNSAFDKSRLKNKKPKKILGKTIYISSAEDLILIKAVWYRQSHSSRHIEDIESVFRISGIKLDKKYLKKWAERLNVTDLIEKFI